MQLLERERSGWLSVLQITKKAQGNKMEKAKYSTKDSRGMACVDCTECERGINGTDIDKCSAGAKHKKGNKGSCFCGKLISTLKIDD